MNYDEVDKLDLIHGLCKLFSEIDINGDKKMEWREFTQYIIDAVMQDNIKEDGKGEMPNQKEMLEWAHSKKFLRFGQSLCTDNIIHEASVQKAVYYPIFNRLMIIETQSHSIKFASLDLRRKETIDLYNKEHDNFLKNGDDDLKNGQEHKIKYFVLSAEIGRAHV